ncbi:hypothetical protein HYW58_02355 [Candidatus Kaiserbacteria bacterium]|nr:hypothetical protein [Candidatus Kaiserbacteria bacterium]
MIQRFLVTRPEYDYTTRYLSSWIKQCFPFIESKKFSIIDLHRTRANRKEFHSVISKRNLSYIVLNGHGNTTKVAGNGDDEILLEAGKDSDVLKGKVTYAVSCQSARILGKEVGKNKDTTYIGYNDDFAFIYLEKHRTRPLEDRVAAIFLDPSNAIVISLFKGHMAGEAVSRGKQEFLKNIQRLLTSKIGPDEYSALRYLVWDMKQLVLYGDSRKKII